MPDITSGLSTSEGKGAAIAALAPIIAAFVGHLSGWQLVAALGVVAGVVCVYTVCRTWLKVRGIAGPLLVLVGVFLAPELAYAAEGETMAHATLYALVVGMVVAALVVLIAAIARAVLRTKGRFFWLGLLLPLGCLSGCTLQHLAAGVETARTMVGGYHLATHAARAAIIQAHSECKQETKQEATACYELALVPFESSQLPVLACFPPLATLVEGAEVALQAKDVEAAKGLIPELAAKTAACGLAIAAAVPGGAK